MSRWLYIMEGLNSDSDADDMVRELALSSSTASGITGVWETRLGQRIDSGNTAAMGTCSCYNSMPVQQSRMSRWDQILKVLLAHTRWDRLLSKLVGS